MGAAAQLELEAKGQRGQGPGSPGTTEGEGAGPERGPGALGLAAELAVVAAPTCAALARPALLGPRGARPAGRSRRTPLTQRNNGLEAALREVGAGRCGEGGVWSPAPCLESNTRGEGNPRLTSPWGSPCHVSNSQASGGGRQNPNSREGSKGAAGPGPWGSERAAGCVAPPPPSALPADPLRFPRAPRSRWSVSVTLGNETGAYVFSTSQIMMLMATRY